MKSDKYTSLTLKVQLGDLEIYTALDMGFKGDFGVSPQIHSHPYYEIITVIDGSLRLEILDNENIELEKGELCIIPPKCFHSTYAVGELPQHFHSTSASGNLPKMLAIRFSYSRVAGDSKIYDSFCSALGQISAPTCLDMPKKMPQKLLELRQEIMEKKIAWKFMCRPILEELYVDIFRLLSSNSESDLSSTVNDSKHSRYHKIEMWFDDNFSKPITEDILAQDISLSKRQLSRVLTDIYGMSFSEKLTEVRLHRAAQLLEATKLNINEVALSVGYKSYSGFHRAFVNYFGIRPLEYRKHNDRKDN